MEVYETLPIVPLRDVVVFPHMMMPFVIGRPSSTRALEHALMKDKRIFLAAQHDASVDDPRPEDIYTMGCVANVVQSLKLPDSNIKVLVEGVDRARAVERSLRPRLRASSFAQANGDRGRRLRWKASGGGRGGGDRALPRAGADVAALLAGLCQFLLQRILLLVQGRAHFVILPARGGHFFFERLAVLASLFTQLHKLLPAFIQMGGQLLLLTM